MVRSLDLLCQGHLAVNAPDSFGLGETITFPEARDLRFSIGGDDDDFVHSFVDTSFEQKRHIVNYHGCWICSSSLSCPSGLFACDTGMDDLLKLAQLGPVSEDNGSQFTAIEGAVRVKDGLAEHFHDLAPGRLVRLHDFTGKFVGINDDRAASLEHLGDGALAGSDAARETD